MGQVVVLGLIAGGIYGLLAVGVVLVYRGSGALNFAQGEMGTVGLFAAWWLVTDHGLPWIVGAAAAVGVAAAMGWAFEFTIVRHMVEATRISVAVATVGLLTFLYAGELRLFTASPRELRGPIEGVGTQVFGVFVSPTQWLSLGVTIAIGLGLAAFLRRSDFGLGVLAAAQDPSAVRLVGVPLARVSGFVWATGAAISAVAALLIEPTIGVFTAGFASGLFLRGLTAAVIGGLTSLPGAFVGGIAVGLLENAAKHWLSDLSVPGIDTLAVFVVLLAVLFLRPHGLLEGLGSVRRRPAVPA